MATIGLCHYCMRPSALACQSCGMAVCDDHTAVDAPGFCIGCARGVVVA